MYERMAWLGGRCTVESRPGVGTRVVAEVALPAEVDTERGEVGEAIEEWTNANARSDESGAPGRLLIDDDQGLARVGAAVALPAAAAGERGEEEGEVDAIEERRSADARSGAAGAPGAPPDR